MTLDFKVSPEEEARLQAAAAERGQEVRDCLLTLARQEFQAKPPAIHSKYEGMTLAEALAGRIGLIASAEPSNMAENSEEELDKIMDEKKCQGHV